MGNFWKTPGGAAVISGAGSIGSGLLGGLFAGRQQKRQYQYNLKLQKQQQDWQRQMWNLENMYNLPANEVKRLLDAGINPALAFSNGGASAAPVPVSGSSGGVSAPVPDFGNPGAAAVSAMNQSRLAESQVELNDATAAKERAQANAANEQAGLSKSYANMNDLLLGVARENRSFLVNAPRVQYRMDLLNETLLGNKVTRDTVYTGYYPTELQQGLELNRWNIKSAQKQVDFIQAETDLLVARKVLTEEQAYQVRLQAMAIEAEALISHAKADAIRDLQRTGLYGKSGFLTTFFDAVRSQVSDDLQSGVLSSRDSKLNAGLDLSFTREYGSRVRDLNFNLYQQQHTLNRSQLWLNGANIVFGAFNANLSRMSLGPKNDYYRSLSSSLDRTSTMWTHDPYTGNIFRYKY